MESTTIKKHAQSEGEGKKQTYADYYLKTPVGWGYELFDGNIRDMAPAPYPRHQRILYEITMQLGEHVKRNDAGIIMLAPTDVYFDEYNCVQPDLLFISKERMHILTEKNIQGAPDLIIEIVSPHHRRHDTVEKKELYERFGVKEYWLVFPEDEKVEVLVLNKPGSYELFETYKKTDTLESSEVLPGLKIRLNEIF